MNGDYDEEECVQVFGTARQATSIIGDRARSRQPECKAGETHHSVNTSSKAERTRNMSKLEETVAIATGASIAKHLAAQGAMVDSARMGLSSRAVLDGRRPGGSL